MLTAAALAELTATMLVVGPARPAAATPAPLPAIHVPAPATDPAFAKAVGARPADLTGGQVVTYRRGNGGRAIVVFGDLATATHVAVYVPGSGTDLRHLATKDRPWRRTLGAARSLAEESNRLRPAEPTAVVAWLGYDAPADILESASDDLAEHGAPELVRYVHSLRAPGRHLTVVGHSYGTVVAALASRDAAADSVDDLVALGSPGMHADHAADLGTHARVWVGLAEHDWIRRIPNMRIGHYGHGAEPADPDFGARILPTRDTAGHDGYLAPGTDSLRAVAEVVTGTRES
jgi:hypothetical protein